MAARNVRNERFFGAAGQAKIASARIAIVGLGGLGSPLAQQLAYLGVLGFALIDGDRVTDSSLNRLIGATPADVGAFKVDVSGRLIASIQPDAVISRLPQRLESQGAFATLRTVDYIFGCLDHDGPRAILVEFCHAYERPYFDLASDIDPDADPIRYGGRVVYCDDATGCRRCRAPGLDQSEIDDYGKSARDRDAEERSYGVQKAGLVGGGPSVVSINGVVASLAVTEFLVQVTGVRPAARELDYAAHRGTVSRSFASGESGCYYCRTVRGQGEAADLDRYIRAAAARDVS